jgi:hypothetical protein
MGNGSADFFRYLMLFRLSHYLEGAFKNALHGRGPNSIGGIDATGWIQGHPPVNIGLTSFKGHPCRAFIK